MKNTLKNEDKVLAQLALQFGKVNASPVGPIPDDEELAALADNLLDDTRRAQVLGHIASDARLYQKWINIVDALTLLETDTGASTVVHSSQPKSSLRSKIGQWLFGSTFHSGAVRGGLAAALVLMLAVFLFPSRDDLARLNAEYDQWGPVINQQWDAFPHSEIYTRPSSESRAFVFKTQTQLILEYAYRTGAKTLGTQRYVELGLNMESELGEAPEIAEDLSRQQYDALLVLGRLAALTTLQCQLPLKVTAFGPVYAEIVKVTGQLRGISDEKIANLVTTILKNESDKAAVCKFTENVIRLIY